MFALERTYHNNTDESHKRIENILSVKKKKPVDRSLSTLLQCVVTKLAETVTDQTEHFVTVSCCWVCALPLLTIIAHLEMLNDRTEFDRLLRTL